MKRNTQITTKVLEAMYKLQSAELKLYRDDLLGAVNFIEEAKRLILNAYEEKSDLAK